MIPFGERLRQARAQAGLSQEALAEALEKSKMTVLRWENGQAEGPPDFRQLELLSALLKVPVAWFFQTEEQRRGAASMASVAASLYRACILRLSARTTSKSLVPTTERGKVCSCTVVPFSSTGDVALDRLTAAARALELPEGILWHTLRHTFISRLVMLGTPLPTVQKLARHKSLSMTMRYSHMCPDHTRQALAALDSFAAPTKRP